MLNLATDDDGRYDFSTVDPPVSTNQYATAPRSLELTVEGYAGIAPLFQILHQQQLPTARIDIDPATEDCTTNFDFRAGLTPDVASDTAAADWPALIQLYQRSHRAWQLLESLDLAQQAPRPFHIYASCNDPMLACPASVPGAPSEFAGFVVGIGSDPFIVLGEGTSQLDHLNAPDNREYHEIGHLAHYLLTAGQIPIDPDNTNHGGYYANPSSTDSWVEGFASFFSMMVSKHAEGDRAPERYRLYGADYDLEADHRAWEWLGWWEELAVSGLLLDLEDGSADYQARPSAHGLQVVATSTINLNGIPAVSGDIRNTSDAAVAYAEVTVELLNASGAVIYRTATPVFATTLAAGARSQFLAPLPYYLDFASVRATPGPMHASDDDPVDLTLDELIAVLRDYSSAHPLSAGRLFDVADLHTALSEAFGGADADANGIDDIDQLFIAHGLFADTAGTRPQTAPPGAAIGLTTHPAYQGYPTLSPRRDVPASPAAVATLNIAPHTNVLVHVEHATPEGAPGVGRSYGYVYRTNAAGEIMLPAPTRLSGSTITLVALPGTPDETPQLLGQASAAALWDQWDSTSGDSLDFQAAVSTTRPPIAPTTSPVGQRPSLLLILVVVGGLLTTAAYVWVLTRNYGQR